LSTVFFTAIVIITVVIIDDYILDVLMRDLVGHDHAPSAFVVYLFLWRATAGTRPRHVRVSHNTIAAETGLSKSSVQAALRHLTKRRLVRSERETPTSTPVHYLLRPWVRR
jgi:DNA-binding MarR family transcriptional regulator